MWAWAPGFLGSCYLVICRGGLCTPMGCGLLHDPYTLNPREYMRMASVTSHAYVCHGFPLRLPTVTSGPPAG